MFGRLNAGSILARALTSVSLLAIVVGCPGAAPPPVDAEGVRLPNETFCPRSRPAPHLLPGVRPEHRTAGFWISRSQNPDALVLDPAEIDELNQRALGLASDRGGLGARFQVITGQTRTAPIIARMNKALEHHRTRAEAGSRVTLDGDRPSPTFFDQLGFTQRRGEGADSLHIIAELTELRCHPTAEGLYEYEGDVDFDMMLCSTLRPGEVLRVISSHPNGWRLVRTAYAAGWLREEQLPVAVEEDELRRFLMADPFVVVTRDRTPVWETTRRRRAITDLRVGLRLPRLASEPSRLVRVLAPTSEGLVEAFVDSDAVHDGYFPMTRRNVLTHAFARLDDAFGWAGAGGDRDCSRFLMDLFALFGLQLPRNSYFQSQATSFVIDTSEMTSLAERRAALDRASARGVAFVFMPGHIMLWLGHDGRDSFAIHQFSGYRVGCRPGHDVKMSVDRLSVTTLRLGEGSERHSFMERFTAIAVIGPPVGSISQAQE